MLTGKNRPNTPPLPPDTRKATGSFARAVASYVPKLTSKAFERHGFHSAEIMTAWGRVVGADFAAFSEPERIRWPRAATPAGGESDTPDERPGATLVLRVDPARALDVEYRGRELIERINRYFGYRAIDTLRIVQAPLKRREAPALAPARATADTTPMPALEAASDPNLKAALAALWSSVRAERSKP